MGEGAGGARTGIQHGFKLVEDHKLETVRFDSL